MKNYYIFILMIILNPLKAQYCPPGSKTEVLKSGNLNLSFTNANINWSNNADDESFLTLSDGSQLKFLFNESVWFSGMAVDDSIYVSANTFSTATEGYDFKPGSLDDNGDINDCINWDRFFRVESRDIIKAEQLYIYGELSKESLPENILYWPARGNPHFFEKYGFELENRDYASFWDENSDGIYNPLDGDIPMLSDTFQSRPLAFDKFPSYLVFNIFNDVGNGSHLLTRGKPMHLEISRYIYTYDIDCGKNIYFVKYKVSNKSEKAYFNFKASIWQHPTFDRGKDFAINKALGTDASNNSTFSHPTDLQVPGENGLNVHPVLVTRVLDGLNTPKKKIEIDDTVYYETVTNPNELSDIETYVDDGLTGSMYMLNCNVGNYNPATCDPAGNDLPFYYMINNHWLDGVPLSSGGYGYNPSTSESTNFVFYDNPSNPNGWSTCTLDFDIRDFGLLTTVGPNILFPGSHDEFTYAVTVDLSTSDDCPDIEKINQDIADCIENINLNYSNIEERNIIDVKHNTFGNELVIENGEVPLDLYVYNLQGQLCFRNNLSVLENYRQNLDELQLVDGMYVVRLVNVNMRKSMEYKFVKY
ncbi:MAG TPA: T9SS type A sorting domain-containing protein [Saprospiraceae bacterium]|nr:T9SS type A sorting domain-containing protein [Saprospiraceae bacterium]